MKIKFASREPLPKQKVWKSSGKLCNLVLYLTLHSYKIDHPSTDMILEKGMKWNVISIQN